MSIPELTFCRKLTGAERARSLAIATVCDVSIPRQGGSHPQGAGAASGGGAAGATCHLRCHGKKWGSRRMSRGRCQRGLRHLRRRLISLVSARAEQPPAPKPAATMPVSTSAPSAKALGKRKTSDVAEPQRASKQPKLRCEWPARQSCSSTGGSCCAEGRRGHRLH
jgi:hypothetical protein